MSKEQNSLKELLVLSACFYLPVVGRERAKKKPKRQKSKSQKIVL